MQGKPLTKLKIEFNC